MVLRIALVTAVVIALVTVELTSRSGVSWRLVTFTYQVNLLAALYYAWTLASPRADARVGVRGAVVLYVVVAGVIWNLFLTGHSLGYTAANLLLHVVVPVLAVTDWLLVGRGIAKVRWWQPFAWLAYPAAYGVVALVVLNRLGRRAPYFFLDPASVGVRSVATNVGLLAAGILGLGFVLLALTRVPSANAWRSQTELACEFTPRA
jgi:hypothetical protein